MCGSDNQMNTYWTVIREVPFNPKIHTETAEVAGEGEGLLQNSVPGGALPATENGQDSRDTKSARC